MRNNQNQQDGKTNELRNFLKTSATLGSCACVKPR